MPLWLYWFITGISVLLVGSAILLIVCMTWRLAGKGWGSGRPGVSTSNTITTTHYQGKSLYSLSLRFLLENHVIKLL